MRLPYLGLNVDRLPELLADLIAAPKWSRSDLQRVWAVKFGVSEKTAKEYVGSLVNLNVLAKNDGAVELTVTSGDEGHEQIVQLAMEGDWGGFIAFISSRVPEIELIRSLYVQHRSIYQDLDQRSVVQDLRERLTLAGVERLERSKTLEAFLRILERAQSTELRAGQAVRIALDRLSPRLRTAVESLSPRDSQLFQQLIAVCQQLVLENPVYERTRVFSIGDVAQVLSPSGGERDWAGALRRLRDRNLLTLHRTIPSAARQLGLTTIRDGGGLASALSLPRKVWTAASGEGQ